MERILLLAVLLLSACAAPVVYEDERLSYKRKVVDGTTLYALTNSVGPVYPDEIRAEETEGYVAIKLDISKSGEPENIEVVASEPAGVFDQFALDAANQWRYLPAEQNGVPVTTKDVVTLLTFCIYELSHAPENGHDICKGPDDKRRISAELPQYQVTYEP